jgi:lipid II:glycine glycyltransferase (peptidoglycan interpeptide bridge formation enzyme)
MNIEIVRTLGEEEWRRFVEEHPQGSIFHTPEMFEVFRRVKGYHPELWVAMQDKRILALLLTVKITLMNGLLRYFTTRAVSYGSVLWALDAEGENGLARLLRTYTQEVKGAPLFTELRNLSNLEAIQPLLRENGFVYEDHLNYLIDLKCTPDAVFENFGRRTRKNIRRGLRQGEVLIEEAKEQKQLAVCYDLLRQTYQAARVPLADRSLFEAAFELLRPKGMVQFTLARVGQAHAAVSVELLYKDVIYGWFGGVDRAYGSYVPNELVMWNILKWGAENGYRVYDFGGAGKPDEEYGVRDFKAKFGGKLVSFGRNICVHSPLLLRLSKLVYGVFRRFL